MRWCRLILIFVILAGVVQNGFGQWATVRFAYGPPSRPVIGGDGQPAPAGTFIRVMHDLGPAGPDPGDTIVSGLNFRGPVPWGYFLDLYGIGVPHGINVYLAVSLPDTCWYTIDYAVIGGSQGLLFADYQMFTMDDPCPWGDELPICAQFRYCRAWNGPVLGCRCGDAVPFADGTTACFFHDVNQNGPDEGDTLLRCLPSHWDTEDSSCWEPDLPLVIDHPGGPMHVYLRVFGDACCWTSPSYGIEPGQPDVWIGGSDWTCDDVACPPAVPIPQVDVAFCYFDDGQGDPEPPLTDLAGQPIHDGTLIAVAYDSGSPGPDASDPVLLRFPSNGESLGLGAGYFSMEPTPVDSGTIVYLGISLPDRCWYTTGYEIPPAPSGCIAYGDWATLTPLCPWDSTLAVNPSVPVPDQFHIVSIYPNPFNSIVQIELVISQSGPVTVDIYNISGQLVKTLANGNFSAGLQQLTWDSRSDANLPVGSGVYLCHASSHGSTVVSKLLLLQ